MLTFALALLQLLSIMNDNTTIVIAITIAITIAMPVALTIAYNLLTSPLNNVWQRSHVPS